MFHLVDLHTHTTASDGQYSPSQLVELAKKRGIEVLAVTDHDTLDGTAEAEAAGKKLNLRVIRGVELSAKEYDTFHILGYHYSSEAPSLRKLCSHVQGVREGRNERLISFLREKGFPLSLDEVESLAGGDIVGRPHFAQAMLNHSYVSNRREAFDLWLDTPEYHQKVDRDKPSVRECIDAIKADGGFVSLAHPYQLRIPDDALDALVKNLKGYGLDAIECYYSRFTPKQQAFYLSLAEKNHLHITGGSDFHGEQVKPDIALTAWKLDLGWMIGDN